MWWCTGAPRPNANAGSTASATTGSAASAALGNIMCSTAATAHATSSGVSRAMSEATGPGQTSYTVNLSAAHLRLSSCAAALRRSLEEPYRAIASSHDALAGVLSSCPQGSKVCCRCSSDPIITTRASREHAALLEQKREVKRAQEVDGKRALKSLLARSRQAHDTRIVHERRDTHAGARKLVGRAFDRRKAREVKARETEHVVHLVR
mmetsp:Transcript_21336/g.49804  ORF Transcript_21336/g.49804 Transcript_21336/m.49804 type:complete len:208 (-) Transcript_21336:624-1247(-)